MKRNKLPSEKTMRYFSDLLLEVLKDHKPVKRKVLVDLVQNLNTKETKFSGRVLRYTVNYMRANGVAPIIGSDDGYQLTKDKALILKSINRLKSSVSTQMDAIYGLTTFIR